MNINEILARPCHNASSERGADMGRPNQTQGKPECLHLQRLNPVDGDYDTGGAYWGFGRESKPVWCAFSPENTENDEPIMVFVRAREYEEAQREVLELLDGEGWTFATITGQPLSDRVLADAAYDLYCVEYADVLERHGGSHGMGAQIIGSADRPDDAELIKAIKGEVEDLEKAWKRPVHEVFDLMGLKSEEERANALYYTLMGCRGTGLCLSDNYSDHIAQYESLVKTLLDPSPFHTELTAINDLAELKLETPDVEWGIYEGEELIEGRFWSEDAAEQAISDCSAYDEETHEARLVSRE